MNNPIHPMINQFDPKNRAFLEGIQGNILKAHGRHHTANVFIRCDGGKSDKAKDWLKSLVNGEESLVQSAYAQLRANVLFKESKSGVDTGIFACIHISGIGYQYLFAGDPRINAFETSFREGMKKAKDRLGDPGAEAWDFGLQADNHFMLLLAHANEAELDKAIDAVYQGTQFFASITTIERGKALFNAQGAGIEHFGYVDGVSQPLFFEDEWEAYKATNAIRNEAEDIRFDPRATQELVLVADPFAPVREDEPADPHALGSYFVFRKLEQNVKGFKLAESKMADDLGLKEGDDERTGAMLIGRFEDGTPVQLDGREGLIHSALLNNFDYELKNEKDDNAKCPFHAHIRKTNPRSGLKDAGNTPAERMKAAKARIMARRGITYGTRTDEPNDGHIYNKPEKEVGLLFMSYQASIERQFEFIQRSWANRADFPADRPEGSGTIGIDPIIGQGDRSVPGDFATEWGNAGTLKPASFEQFVHLKGGEYFFAPSMQFLKNINTTTNSVIQ